MVPFTPAPETTAEVAPEAPASPEAPAFPGEQPSTPKSVDEAVAAIVAKVDINQVSHHDLIHDIFQNTQEFAFKCILTARLFEAILVKDASGIRGEVLHLLRTASDETIGHVHVILKSAAPVVPEASADTENTPEPAGDNVVG